MPEKIKLVHIISNLGAGGAQVLLFDILNHLRLKDDLDITVITIDSGEYISKFEEAGIKVIDIKQKGLINYRIFFILRRILKEILPDIVHTHLNKADFYGRLAAKSINTNLIFTTYHTYSSHHKGADINKKSFFDIIDNIVTVYTGSKSIAISDIVKKYLVNRNNTFTNKTIVIYNGVKLEKERQILSHEQALNLRNNFNIGIKDFVIAVLGRLEISKGQLFFLDSLKKYLKEKNNIKILILGEGSLRKNIEELIEDNNLKDYVTLLGFKIDPEEFIEISDLICVPSSWEGFGLIITEAMIKRKIVLASNVGGIPEIVKDGETGFLFEYGDKTSLIEKLNYIYENYEMLTSITERAIEIVKNKFDVEKNSELYYKLYQNTGNNLKM